MRRLVSSRLRADEGLSLIETVAALLVFGLLMGGLTASMTLMVHATAVTKARNAATSLAQQLTETARTFGSANLMLCAGGGQPSSFPFQGTSYTVVSAPTGSAAPCVTFNQTRKASGYTFGVKQYVLNKPATGTFGPTPQVDKIFIAQLTWTSPTSGSYEADTTVSGNGTVPTQIPQGLQINVDDTSGNLINLNGLIWDYEITNGSTVDITGSTEDGTTGVLSVDPGSYTCILTAEPDAAQSYNPSTASGDNSGMTVDVPNDKITGTCTTSANQVTSWTTKWAEVANCTSTASKGALTITVLDQSGKAVNGATVTLTNANGNGGVPAAVNSNTNGQAVWGANTVPGDLYTFTITKTGYNTASNLGPICVAAGTNNSGQGTISAVQSCQVSKTNAKIVVTVTDENGNPVGGATVTLTGSNNTAHNFTTSTKADATLGTVTITSLVGDSYSYVAKKTGYTTTLPGGPTCAPPTVETDIPITLPTNGSTGCATGKTNGTLQVTVTDLNNNPLQNVKITPTSLTAGTAKPAVTTGSNGVASTNIPADNYSYTVTPPAGYQNPGIQGPVCVVAGQVAKSTVALVGVMTVVIKITNADTQPTKNYVVTLTDSQSNNTSNSTTLNKGKTGSLTFANMPTDTYTIDVCVPVQSTGNCSAINTTTTTYNFGTINTTYTASFTDSTGGA